MIVKVLSSFSVVSWCCRSPIDVTFSLFCASHYNKDQVFIQPLQILISTNKCKIPVGLSVPTNSRTTFNLIKLGFQAMNQQTDNWQILSVSQNRQIH